MDAIPMVDVAMITGSTSWGIAVPEDVDLPGVRVIARDLTFETPYGLSQKWKLIKLVDGIQRLVPAPDGGDDFAGSAVHEKGFGFWLHAARKRLMAA